MKTYNFKDIEIKAKDMKEAYILLIEEVLGFPFEDWQLEGLEDNLVVGHPLFDIIDEPEVVEE